MPIIRIPIRIPIRILWLLLLCWCCISTVKAQITSTPIVLIPLDSRPVNYFWPQQLAELQDMQVLTPPIGWLGTAKKSAQLDTIQDWLITQNAKQYFMALDTLAYGGLVQSRTSSISSEKAIQNLQIVRELAQQGKQIYGFIVVPRYPDAVQRERNLAVIQRMITWAEAGIFSHLRIAWDDALPKSPAINEVNRLRVHQSNTISFAPGADEVMMTLMARILGQHYQTLKVTYSQPERIQERLNYDGLPLGESIQAQAQAMGMSLVSGRAKADLNLYVYTGGDTHRAAVTIDVLSRQPLVFADLQSVNLSNWNLWQDLLRLRSYYRLLGIGGWGTPANNIGSALAQAQMSYGAPVAKQRDVMAARYQNDVLYSAWVRSRLRKQLPEAELNSPNARSQLALLSLAQPQLSYPNGYYRLRQILLPWSRSFESQAALEFVPTVR